MGRLEVKGSNLALMSSLMVREHKRKKKPYNLAENIILGMRSPRGSNKHNRIFGVISIDSFYVMMCKLALILFVENYDILLVSSAFAQIFQLWWGCGQKQKQM